MNISNDTRRPSPSTVSSKQQALQITPFHAGQLLTLDGVSVNMEAAVCWHMQRAVEAETTFEQSQQAIAQLVQSMLVTCIHASTLSGLLTEPGAISAQLRQGIGEKLAPMGVVVHAVELQGVSLPEGMDANNDTRLLLEMNLRLSRHRLDRVTEGIRQQLHGAAQGSLGPAP